MNNLFSAHWSDTGRKATEQEPDRLDRQPSGFGRLLVAVAMIEVAVSLLDHAAAKARLGPWSPAVRPNKEDER
ncbi:hypothetical protein [Mesorhizobium sp.]|uniref:hypothetical protein n=1 Tax=Mesorhizobium sp. TaxID=1871066 RepID=UPI00257DD86E|nr:hypothetical protein [Mesorhizobium sp.]